jgi:hypothetical protein
MSIKILYKSLLMPAVAFALAACAGNTPCPATDAAPQASAGEVAADTQAVPQGNAPAGESSIAGDKSASAPGKQAGTPQSDASPVFTSSALDSYRLASPDSIPATSPHKGGSADNVAHNTPIPVLNDIPVDPYTAFPALVSRVFAYADSLYAQGLTDSASAYLQRFRIIKPLWNTWETQADSMLNEFGKTRAEKAKAFEPYVLTIQNMNRVQAAYSMVKETADSLIALAPGDSLVNWANGQMQVAYKNTLAKAKKEYASIKALADDHAQFKEAAQKANELQMRYRDFEKELQIQSLIDYIAGLMAANDSEAAKYWESHDPAQALAKADTLIKASKFADAKSLLTKLKASNLRKEANDKYQELATTFCNAQRKATSQIFAKAQKQKDAAKKKKLLQDAIAPLDKCLAEYPEYTQKQKVVDNKSFLEKELAK